MEASSSCCQHLRQLEPDRFHAMVKMHLSFLLDLNTDECDCAFVCDQRSGAGDSSSSSSSIKRRIFTPKKSKSSSSGASSSAASSSKIMDGAALTQEGVCQVYQLIQYLGRDYNIGSEGLFRKNGNLKKQSILKERLNKGVTMNLDEGEFSVHECAAVLKSFLSEQSEPLLTDAYYRAHCQVAQLVKGTMTLEETAAAIEKKISSLQLLFLLIPAPNLHLLKDLLVFLRAVSKHESTNLMSSHNLGMMFAPLILCPRKLSAESLQSNHQLLTKAVAFMIDKADELFQLPPQLVKDVEQLYLTNELSLGSTPHRKLGPGAPSLARGTQSPVVNTIFSFVDRKKTSELAAESSTETALAQLYAHVQAMPESAQKKRMVQKLNDANGHGTPGFIRAGGGGSRLKNGGEGLINLLTPRRNASKNTDHKLGRNGSYSFKTPVAAKPPSQFLHSFKKQDGGASATTPGAAAAALGAGKEMSQKLLSPQSSPAILVSPSAIDNIGKKQPPSRAVSNPEGMGGTPAPEPDSIDLDESEDVGENLDGSYIAPTASKEVAEPVVRKAPPVPVRLSSLDKTPCGAAAAAENDSPITNCTQRMTSDMKKSMMTPGSRKPVLAVSTAHMDKFKIPPVAVEDPGVITAEPANVVFIPDESPCQPPKYNEDEPDQVEDNLKEGGSVSLVEENNSFLDRDEVEHERDEDVESTESESNRYFASLADDDSDEPDRDVCCSSHNTTPVTNTPTTHRHLVLETPGVSQERDLSEIIFKNRAYANTTTPSHETKALNSSDSVLERSSVLETSTTSSVISNEARMLLNGEMGLSESMYAVMNGDEPCSSESMRNDQVHAPVTPSVLIPVDVDSFLSDIPEDDKENNGGGSFTSAKSDLSSSSASSSVALPEAVGSAAAPLNEIPLPILYKSDKHIATSTISVGDSSGAQSATSSASGSPNGGEQQSSKDSTTPVQKSSSRKRRSLTELADLNPMSSSGPTAGKKNNIYFETDL